MKTGCFVVRRIFSLVFLVFIGAVGSLTSPALATDIPPYGGPGGGEFRSECAPGWFLVGAKVRYGAFLDQIQIECTSLDAATGSTGLIVPIAPPVGGGGGGGPAVKDCIPNYVVVGAGIQLFSNQRYVKTLDLQCKNVISGVQYLLANVGAPSSLFADVFQTCPAGEAVTGIHGRSGIYVDAIGLICRQIPQVPPPPPPEPTADGCLGIEGDAIPAQWKDMLDIHNKRRAEHCVAPLKWSGKLAEEAQAYADKCILDAHGSDGENLADAWSIRNGVEVLPALSDPEAYQQAWYCEVNNYDFDNPQFEGGFTSGCVRVNGHFTQVVWKDTCQLGCGRATCDMKDDKGVVHKGTHWVCRYSPPGNVNVEDPDVLRDQVKRSQCTPPGKG
jgi:hypothetical protein